MLKRIVYPTASPLYPGEVVYAKFDTDKVVFSGITQPGSTINFAEEIIENIAYVEGLEIFSYRWFDLQTHLGYVSRPSGICDFNELTLTKHQKIKPRPGVKVLGSSHEFSVDWTPKSAPPQVLNLFREYIGELSVKIWQPDEARQAGYRPTDRHSLMPGWCFQMVGLLQNQADLARQAPAHLRPIVARIVKPTVMNVLVVVDHGASPEFLKISKGNRYCIWERNPIRDN